MDNGNDEEAEMGEAAAQQNNTGGQGRYALQELPLAQLADHQKGVAAQNQATNWRATSQSRLPSRSSRSGQNSLAQGNGRLNQNSGSKNQVAGPSMIGQNNGGGQGYQFGGSLKVPKRKQLLIQNDENSAMEEFPPATTGEGLALQKQQASLPQYPGYTKASLFSRPLNPANLQSKPDQVGLSLRQKHQSITQGP